MTRRLHERMLDKPHRPSAEDIRRHVGEVSFDRLTKLEALLEERYDLCRELRFPFGNSYGWGFKYSHRKKHLFYLFFERGALTATIQIGDDGVGRLNDKLGSLLPKTQGLWADRYPCGAGGWVHYRILEDDELADVVELIAARKAPTAKRSTGASSAALPVAATYSQAGHSAPARPGTPRKG